MGNDICDLLCGIFCDREQIILEKEVSKFQFVDLLPRAVISPGFSLDSMPLSGYDNKNENVSERE